LAGGLLYKYLRHGGKSKKIGDPAGVKHIPNRVDIAERPAIVDEKSRIGDWEADCIISHGSRCALVTLVERFSKYTIIIKVGKRTKVKVQKAIVKILKKLGFPVKTITYDNGGEFADHESPKNRRKFCTTIPFLRTWSK
jgi:IS30 family transposase